MAIDLLNIARTGVLASQSQLGVTSNNIANSATAGFKSGSTEFAAVYNGGQRGGVGVGRQLSGAQPHRFGPTDLPPRHGAQPFADAHAHRRTSAQVRQCKAGDAIAPERIAQQTEQRLVLRHRQQRAVTQRKAGRRKVERHHLNLSQKRFCAHRQPP